jgi:hypothetical protein
VRTRFVITLVFILLFFALHPEHSRTQVAWPDARAPHIIEITKVAGLEDPGGLVDRQWIHLHRGHQQANAPTELRADPVAGPWWLAYVRLNAHAATTMTVPPRPPANLRFVR